MNKYINKTIEVKYETGYHFKISYVTENRLHWVSQKVRVDGGEMEGEEFYYFNDEGNDLYMISWVEKSGLVVSQILNFKRMTVYAFMTWEDNNERGKRGVLAHKGNIQSIEDIVSES